MTDRIHTEPEGRAAPTLADLMAWFPRDGRLEWIGVRPGRRAPLTPLEEVRAVAGKGLAGDHYRPGKTGRREVTLIQSEHLPVIGALLGLSPPTPERLRRNLLVSGINLIALRGMRFRIGLVLLEGTGLCHPCSRMEEALGLGGYNAMRGHGGLNARVLEGGVMRLGDPVQALGLSEDDPDANP
jgi:MOSC domain-containing protein YiiM